MRRLPLVLGLAGLLAAGCRSYSAESVDAIYRDVLQWEGRDDAAAARRPSEVHWKRVEEQKAITLGDAFRISLARSERIARAAETYLQSLAVQDQAVAAVLPTVGVQATQFYQDPVPASFTSGVVTISPNRRQVALTLAQPIFHGLKDFAAWRQSQAAIDGSRNAFETERRLLFQTVASAFFTTLFYERQQKILEDALKNSRDRLREMQARQAQGIARKTEVLLIETQVASDEAQLNRGLQSLDLSRNQMAFLLGRPFAVPLRDDVAEPPVPPDVLPLLQRALSERSDLKEREFAVRAAGEQVTIVTSEHYPVLDFNGNYYAYRMNYSAYSKEVNWDALFTLTFNLFHGGDVRARTVLAESQARSAALQRDELARQIEADVRGAHLTWRSDRELIVTLETRERTSRENYTQVVTEYRQGIAGVSNLEVLVAQNQYLSAQLELERSRLQSKLDWFQLENVQGRIPVR
ncbi:MAG: TolC family protein [Planctomycetes bacterium]|nr:TolC family protein [Planctomycetota bacterium]